MLYTGALSTIFAYSAWGVLLRNYSPHTVAPFGLMVPVFSMGFSAILMSEQLTPLKIAAIVLIIGGIALILRGRKSTVKPPPGVGAEVATKLQIARRRRFSSEADGHGPPSALGAPGGRGGQLSSLAKRIQY